MKSRIFLIILLLASASCSREVDPAIVLTRSDWYVQKINYGGAVHLFIEGTATADSLTILTKGDGLDFDLPIERDSENFFSEDVIISFTASAVPVGDFTESTDIKVYKDSKILTVTLTSGLLRY